MNAQHPSSRAARASGLDANDRAVLVATALVFGGALAYGVAQGVVALAAGLGALLLAAAAAAAFASRGGAGSQWLLPVLGMGMVALLIHVARG